jgi:hypothetical protein
MISERKMKQVEDRLNGTSEDFIKAVLVGGFGYAKRLFNLEDVDILTLTDWYESKTGKHAKYDIGLIPNPYEHLDFGDAIVTSFLRKINEQDQIISEQTKEIDMLKKANQYLRRFPLAGINDKLSELAEKLK